MSQTGRFHKKEASSDKQKRNTILQSEDGLQLRIHGRVSLRHPELTEDDIRHAWKYRIAMAVRETAEQDFLVVVGFDTKARMLEIVAVPDGEEAVLVFHAMTPPSIKTLREVGLEKRV